MTGSSHASPSTSTPPHAQHFAEYFFQVGLPSSVNLDDRRLPVLTGVDGSLVDLSVVAVKHVSTTHTKEVSVGLSDISDKDGDTGGLKHDVVARVDTDRGDVGTGLGVSDAPDGVSECSNAASANPTDMQAKDPHPLKYHYQPETLLRYPKQDRSESEKFPAYVPMFCFPNDLVFAYAEDKPPPDTFHSFIITEEDGTKCYGICVTVYEKPSARIYAQLEQMISEWRSENLADTDFEYVEHVQAQLAFHKENLLKLKHGVRDMDEIDLADAIALAEEKVTLYEELMSPLLNTVLVDMDRIFVPECIGVLTHWPWYNFFKDWLCEMLRVLRGAQTKALYFAPLERCVINLVHEIPLPPPGKLEIVVSIGNRQLYCARSPVNSLTGLKNFSLYPVFRSISIHNIVTLLELALTEQKILLVSSHYSMLNIVSESICQLMFPFYWHHILIPVLPSRLISYLQAPMPYIIGVNRKYFTKSIEDEWSPSDAVIVDIDNDTIGGMQDHVGLPVRERRKLISRLEKWASMFVMPVSSRNSASAAAATPSEAGSADAAAPATNRNTTNATHPHRGVPITMRHAFPCGRSVYHTAETHIGARRIHDIPKAMYSRFSNDFLQLKSNVGNRTSQLGGRGIIASASTRLSFYASSQQQQVPVTGTLQFPDTSSAGRPPRPQKISSSISGSANNIGKLASPQPKGLLTINTGGTPVNTNIGNQRNGDKNNAVDLGELSAITSNSDVSDNHRNSDASSISAAKRPMSYDAVPPSSLSKAISGAYDSVTSFTQEDPLEIIDEAKPHHEERDDDVWDGQVNMHMPHHPHHYAAYKHQSLPTTTLTTPGSLASSMLSDPATPSDTLSVSGMDSSAGSSPDKDTATRSTMSLKSSSNATGKPAQKRLSGWWSSTRNTSTHTAAVVEEPRAVSPFGSIFSNFTMTHSVANSGSAPAPATTTANAAPKLLQRPLSAAAAATATNTSTKGPHLSAPDGTSSVAASVSNETPSTPTKESVDAASTAPSVSDSDAGTHVHAVSNMTIAPTPKRNILQRLWTNTSMTNVSEIPVQVTSGSDPTVSMSTRPPSQSGVAAQGGSKSRAVSITPMSPHPAQSVLGLSVLDGDHDAAMRHDDASMTGDALTHHSKNPSHHNHQKQLSVGTRRGSAPPDRLPNIRVILKEGHVFHELIPVLPMHVHTQATASLPTSVSNTGDRIVDIGYEDSVSDIAGVVVMAQQGHQDLRRDGRQASNSTTGGSTTVVVATPVATPVAATTATTATTMTSMASVPSTPISAITTAVVTTSGSAVNVSGHPPTATSSTGASMLPFSEEDELADRFGVDSQSSDEYARSDVSTDVRSQAPSRFGSIGAGGGSVGVGTGGRRLMGGVGGGTGSGGNVAGSNAPSIMGAASGASGVSATASGSSSNGTGAGSSNAGHDHYLHPHTVGTGSQYILDRRHSNFAIPTHFARRETVRNIDLPICRMCHDNLDMLKEKIIMCENCHIQIHAGCIQSTEAHPCAVAFNEDKIRSSFLKVFTSLLRNYRNHLKSLAKPEVAAPLLRMAKRSVSSGGSATGTGSSTAAAAATTTGTTTGSHHSVPEHGHPFEPGSDEWFKKPEFLADFDAETKPFMTAFVDTQAFAQFILDRIERTESDYEVLFFDESIKAKLNRSKLRFTKETTPFLKDASYQIHASVQTLPPNLDEVPGDFMPAKDDALAWDDRLVIPPRNIQPLLTESDHRIMRSHTNELVHRARMASTMRRKQDFSKWMRSKIKYFQKIGGGELVSIGFLSEDQRRELLEQRLQQVSAVIDAYEAAHVSSQTPQQVKEALKVLHEQNEFLVRVTDEEQLVDSSDEDELQLVLMRLVRVITIYEDFQVTFEKSNATQLAVRMTVEHVREASSVAAAGAAAAASSAVLGDPSVNGSANAFRSGVMKSSGQVHGSEVTDMSTMTMNSFGSHRLAGAHIQHTRVISDGHDDGEREDGDGEEADQDNDDNVDTDNASSRQDDAIFSRHVSMVGSEGRDSFADVMTPRQTQTQHPPLSKAATAVTTTMTSKTIATAAVNSKLVATATTASNHASGTASPAYTSSPRTSSGPVYLRSGDAGRGKPLPPRPEDTAPKPPLPPPRRVPSRSNNSRVAEWAAEISAQEAAASRHRISATTKNPSHEELHQSQMEPHSSSPHGGGHVGSEFAHSELLVAPHLLRRPPPPVPPSVAPVSPSGTAPTPATSPSAASKPDRITSPDTDMPPVTTNATTIDSSQSQSHAPRGGSAPAL